MTVWHMNGAGNDFAVVDVRDMNINTNININDEKMKSLAKMLCQRRNCDGFMALDNSSIADIRLHFYNRDGSRAEMCGNGARCICRFAYDNKIVGKNMTVETDAGIIVGKRISEGAYQVKLNTPNSITLDMIGKQDVVDYVCVGVPHIAIALEEFDFVDADKLLGRARALRNEFDANVNFYSEIGKDRFKILTYERGVENFTLACGTGSGAVAAILWSRGKLKNDCAILQNHGGELRVTVRGDKNKITALYLEGGAEVESIEEIEEIE